MKTVIFFGDSIASGTPDTVTSRDQLACEQMKAFTSARIVDLSFAGMRLCRAVAPELFLSEHIPLGINDITNIFSRMNLNSDTYVVVQVCCNDAKNGTPILSIKSQAKAAVDSIMALHANAVLISPVGQYMENVSIASPYNDVRTAFTGIAAAHGCTHINGRSLIDKTNPDFYAMPDDEHLSPLGLIEFAKNFVLAMGGAI